MESVFKAHPTIEVLYVFEDENCFLSKKHAEDYKAYTGLEYKVVERKEKKSEEKAAEGKEPVKRTRKNNK